MEDIMYIKRILLNRKLMEARLQTLQTLGSSDTNMIKNLVQSIQIIDNWMMILTENEALVVRLHLFEHYSWRRVVSEYTEIMGGENSRTDRSLRNYQKSALEKIFRHSSEELSLFNFLSQHPFIRQTNYR